MHVVQSDACDERGRGADAAEVDEVHVQNFSEQLRVGSEAPLPEASANNDLGALLLWSGGCKCFPHQADAENLEELRRDTEPAQPLAAIAAGQVDRSPLVTG